MGHTANMSCQTLKWLILSCSRWCLRWKVAITMDTWWLACFQENPHLAPRLVTWRGKILKSGWIPQFSFSIRYISESFQMKPVQPGIGPAHTLGAVRSGYRMGMDWAAPLLRTPAVILPDTEPSVRHQKTEMKTSHCCSTYGKIHRMK